MSEHALNITLIAAVIVMAILLVREWLHGTGYQLEASELRERLGKSQITYDRMYRERNEVINFFDDVIDEVYLDDEDKLKEEIIKMEREMNEENK